MSGKGCPILRLDAVDAVGGLQLHAGNVGCVHRAAGINGGVLRLSARRGVQRHTAVAALDGTRLVVAAAVGANRHVAGGFCLVGGFGVGLPLKAGGVFCLVYAGTDLFPAFAVVGGAAFGADNNIVCVGKSLLADGTMVVGISCHSLSSFLIHIPIIAHQTDKCKEFW